MTSTSLTAPATISARAAVVSATFGLFAGSLLANGVPHTVLGVIGVAHPTPFGTSPAVNLAWGLANLLIGLGLVLPRAARRAYVAFTVAAAAGALGTAVSLIALWS